MQFLVYGLALLATRQGQIACAARLFGTRWSRGNFYYLSPVERAQYEEALTRIKASLGEARFAQLYEEGRAMTLEQVVALALEEHE